MNLNQDNLVNEPVNEWGGEWTEVKLKVLETYAKQYIRVFKNKQHQKLLYFDGFAGSGYIKHKDRLSEIEGAAVKILNISTPREFDMYYFVEKEEVLAKELEDNLKKGYPGMKIHVVPDDCNIKLSRLADFLKNEGKDYKVLGFIDPKGMQLKWESIKQLKGLPIDLWILNPTSGTNRLLKRNGNIREAWIKRLEEFLGFNEEEIINKFYVKQKNLFGEEVYFKESQAVSKLHKIYAERLKENVFKYVTEPKILKNSRGNILFHFFMATNSPIALRIANSVINPKIEI